MKPEPLDLDPPLKLMPFQEAGSEWLARTPRAMLAWEPGVGKTPPTVDACMRIGAKRILVFCPPIATGVWEDHFLDWSSFLDRDIFVYQGSWPPVLWKPRERCVVIVPYSYASREHSAASSIPTIEKLSTQEWDVVIIDEAHYLKNRNAQRTQTIYGENCNLIGSPLLKVPFIWCLTGTPLLNHPGEFWTHLHALMPSAIMFRGGPLDEDEFIERYCVAVHTPTGYKIKGVRNTTELAEKVKPFIDRKRLMQVYKDMPPLRIVDHRLPENTPIDPKLKAMIDTAILEAFGEVPDGLDDEDLLDMIQSDAVSFSTVRRLIGIAKVGPVVDMVKDLLDDDPTAKVIVFAHHRDVIANMNLKLPKSLVITGATPADARQRFIRLFQRDPAYRVFILAIEAAGEAITLTAAHNVIIAEPSPVPAKNAQAIARAHRKGQTKPVLARFVMLPGTLDYRLASIIARKTRDIAKIVDPDLTPVKPTKSPAVFPEQE